MCVRVCVVCRLPLVILFYSLRHSMPVFLVSLVHPTISLRFIFYFRLRFWPDEGLYKLLLIYPLYTTYTCYVRHYTHQIQMISASCGHANGCNSLGGSLSLFVKDIGTNESYWSLVAFIVVFSIYLCSVMGENKVLRRMRYILLWNDHNGLTEYFHVKSK